MKPPLSHLIKDTIVLLLKCLEISAKILPATLEEILYLYVQNPKKAKVPTQIKLAQCIISKKQNKMSTQWGIKLNLSSCLLPVWL